MFKLKPWPMSDVLVTLAGAALLLAVQLLFMRSMVSTSAMVAGCSAAITVNYLRQYGVSLFTGTLHSRLVFVAGFITAAIVGGGVAVALGAS